MTTVPGTTAPTPTDPTEDLNLPTDEMFGDEIYQQFVNGMLPPEFIRRNADALDSVQEKFTKFQWANQGVFSEGDREFLQEEYGDEAEKLVGEDFQRQAIKDALNSFYGEEAVAKRRTELLDQSKGELENQRASADKTDEAAEDIEERRYKPHDDSDTDIRLAFIRKAVKSGYNAHFDGQMARAMQEAAKIVDDPRYLRSYDNDKDQIDDLAAEAESRRLEKVWRELSEKFDEIRDIATPPEDGASIAVHGLGNRLRRRAADAARSRSARTESGTIEAGAKAVADRLDRRLGTDQAEKWALAQEDEIIEKLGEIWEILGKATDPKTIVEEKRDSIIEGLKARFTSGLDEAAMKQAMEPVGQAFTAGVEDFFSGDPLKLLIKNTIEPELKKNGLLPAPKDASKPRDGEKIHARMDRDDEPKPKKRHREDRDKGGSGNGSREREPASTGLDPKRAALLAEINILTEGMSPAEKAEFALTYLKKAETEAAQNGSSEPKPDQATKPRGGYLDNARIAQLDEDIRTEITRRVRDKKADLGVPTLPEKDFRRLVDDVRDDLMHEYFGGVPYSEIPDGQWEAVRRALHDLRPKK